MEKKAPKEKSINVRQKTLQRYIQIVFQAVTHLNECSNFQLTVEIYYRLK